MAGGLTAPYATPPSALRDTLLLKNPKGVHILEGYRYYTKPFGTAPDPERVKTEWQVGKFRPGPRHHGLNLGMLHQRVRISIRNTEPRRLRFLWSIFNFFDSAALHCRR